MALLHGRCIRSASLGAVLGFAAVAHAQGAAELAPVGVSSPGDPSTVLMLQILQAGGLPAALALVGWLVGRGGIPLHISLSDHDRALLMGSDGKPGAKRGSN